MRRLLQNLKTTDLNQKVCLEESILENKKGIEHETFKLFLETWAFVDQAPHIQKHDHPDCTYLYRVVMRQNAKLRSKTNSIARVVWEDKAVRVSHIYTPTNYPAYIVVLCYD